MKAFQAMAAESAIKAASRRLLTGSLTGSTIANIQSTGAGQRQQTPWPALAVEPDPALGFNLVAP